MLFGDAGDTLCHILDKISFSIAMVLCFVYVSEGHDNETFIRNDDMIGKETSWNGVEQFCLISWRILVWVGKGISTEKRTLINSNVLPDHIVNDR